MKKMKEREDSGKHFLVPSTCVLHPLRPRGLAEKS